MSHFSSSGNDTGIHADAIHALAEQYSLDETAVKEIYESELQKLRNGTRITAFLPVLCVRHVKELIIKSRSG